MAMVIRVAGKEEGEGGKMMPMTTRVAGELTVTAKNRAMATKAREAGEKKRNGKGGKSGGNGKKDGDGKQ